MTRRRFPVGKTLLYVFMSLWALTTIYPFIWVILNSFKPRGLIRSDTFSLPIGDKFTLENYVTAFKRVDIGTAYVNSIVISGAVTVVVMVLAGLAGYSYLVSPSVYSSSYSLVTENLQTISLFVPAFPIPVKLNARSNAFLTAFLYSTCPSPRESKVSFTDEALIT